MRLRRGQGGSGLFEAIVAVEQLVADGDSRHPSDPTRVRLGGGVPELVLDRLRLEQATAEAYERGVRGVPTIAIGDELFYGDDRLEEAASALRGA